LENAIRAAAVWEYLSLGLNVLFVGWVRAIDANDFRVFWRALLRSVNARRMRPRLQNVTLAEEECEFANKFALSCLAHAVRLFDTLPESACGLLREERHFEKWCPFELARDLLDRRIAPRCRAENLLMHLWERHDRAKGDDAWLVGGDTGCWNRVKVNRQTRKSWQPPTKVAMHGYRIPAFTQIARDLGEF
jgi:hypothetical protein